MKIKLCESQINEVVMSEMKRWYKLVKKDPTEKGDKELLKALNTVYEYYSGIKLK
jgi:hypothetical protein